MDPSLGVAQAVVWMMNGAVFPAMTMASSQLLHNIKEETAAAGNDASRAAAVAAVACPSSGTSGTIPQAGGQQQTTFLEDKDIQNVIDDLLKKQTQPAASVEMTAMSAAAPAPDAAAATTAHVATATTTTTTTTVRKSRPRLAQYGDYDKIPRQHKCTECPYQTDNSSHLKRHKNSVHSCIKLYQCYVCFKEYSRLEKLKNHFTKSHPTDVYNSALARKDQSELIRQAQSNLLAAQNVADGQAAQVAGMAMVHPSQASAMSLSNPVFVASCLNSQVPLQPKASSSANQERRYKCDNCPYMGKDSWHLKRHITDVHEVIKLFKCPKCGYGTSRKHRMVSHMKGHGMLACLYCPFETVNLPEYNDHLQFCGKVHRGHGSITKPETFECSICLMNFISMQSLASHLLSTHGLKAQGAANVEDPNKTSDMQQAEEMKRREESALATKFKYQKLDQQNQQNAQPVAEVVHQNQPLQFGGAVAIPASNVQTLPTKSKKPRPSAANKHEGMVGKHKCPHCNFAAKDNWYLRRHLNDVHIKLKLFSCPFCKYCSSRRERLTKHLKQHGELACPHCELKLADKSDFLNHMKACTTSTSNKEQVIACDLCSETCSTFEAFQTHKLEYHNSKLEKCPLCPYSTSDTKALDIHKLTHKNVTSSPSPRPNGAVSGDAYFCTECKSSFSSSEALQSHVQESHQTMHIGPQPKSQNQHQQQQPQQPPQQQQQHQQQPQQATLPSTSHPQAVVSNNTNARAAVHSRPQSVQPPAEQQTTEVVAAPTPTVPPIPRTPTQILNPQLPARPHSVPVEPRSTLSTQHLLVPPATLMSLQSVAAVGQANATLTTVSGQPMQQVSNAQAQTTSQPQAHLATTQMHASQNQPHHAAQMSHQVAFQMAPPTAYNFNPSGVNVGHHAAHTLVGHQPAIMGPPGQLMSQQASHLGQHRLGFLQFNPYAFQAVQTFGGHVHYSQTENGPK